MDSVGDSKWLKGAPNYKGAINELWLSKAYQKIIINNDFN